MKNDIIIDDDFIAKYLAGEATPEEAMVMHEWLCDPDNQLYFEKTQTIWNLTHPVKAPRAVNRQAAWGKISNQSIGDSSVVSSPRVNFFTHYRFALKIAASFLIVISFAFLTYVKFNKPNSSEISISSADSIKNMKLPDNSNITLNEHSTLTYAGNFGKSAREVHFISGEAFFKVTKNKAKPFVVYTKLATIKVLGTSFNATLTKGQLNVSVNEGRVLLYTASDSIYLESGFSGIVRLGKTSIDVQSSVDENTWGYATRKFVFKNKPLHEVIDCLEKAYPYSFDLQNRDIGNCKLTATFDNVSAEYILTLVAETLNLSVTNNGHSFILQGEGCP